LSKKAFPSGFPVYALEVTEPDRIEDETVAYSERCAISGLKLINGSGRAEVAAAAVRAHALL
jgi:hypothetical protein